MSSSSLLDKAVVTPAAADSDRSEVSAGVRLPPELLLEIFGYLKNSQTSLYSASLVCRRWMYCAAPLLYRHAKITDTYHWALFVLTLTRKKQKLLYGSLVQSIDLTVGKSYDPMSRNCGGGSLGSLTVSMDSTSSTSSTSSRTTTNSDNASNTNHNASALDDPLSTHWTDVDCREMKESHVFLTTSSLMQITACKNLVSINLSMTTIFNDTKIEETGEYVSTLQHDAVRCGLTQTPITMELVIKELGKECKQLREITMQRCEWVTAHIIWLLVSHCTGLVRLDARRASKCSVKRLTLSVLELPQQQQQQLMPTESISANTIIGTMPSTDATMEERRIWPLSLLDPEGVPTREDFDAVQENTAVSLIIIGGQMAMEQLRQRHDNLSMRSRTYRASRWHPSTVPLQQPDDPPAAAEYHSLKDIVCPIIKEAKDLGVAELSWFTP
ncbi:hypothetical protein BX666DRAFT_1989806 [Dichotomocladium elegans]|nr:hypothetical protein BX666DRAFT_1989806 [Dichotomocladium elegans]